VFRTTGFYCLSSYHSSVVKVLPFFQRAHHFTTSPDLVKGTGDKITDGFLFGFPSRSASAVSQRLGW
jgi:hypothetical protein